MKKVISIILAVVVIVTGVLVAINMNKQAKINEKIELLNEQMSQYYAQKKAIQRSIDAAWEEYDEVLSGGDCCFVLFVEDITPNLMENAYPLLEDNGYKATVVMKNLQIPTDEGCITLSDYENLTEAGWDFAIGTGELDLTGEDSVAVLADYIAAYKEKLTYADLEMPITFCFEEGQYDKKYTDILLENGFKVIRHYETIRDKFSHGIERNGLYLLSSGTIRTNSTTQMKRDVQTAYEEKFTYAATVRYITETNMEQDKNIDSNKTKYQSMLRFIATDCPEANVFSSTQLYKYKTESVAENAGYMEEFNAKISNWENEIAEIDKAIEDLKNSLEM